MRARNLQTPDKLERHAPSLVMLRATMAPTHTATQSCRTKGRQQVAPGDATLQRCMCATLKHSKRDAGTCTQIGRSPLPPELAASHPSWAPLSTSILIGLARGGGGGAAILQERPHTEPAAKPVRNASGKLRACASVRPATEVICYKPNECTTVVHSFGLLYITSVAGTCTACAHAHNMAHMHTTCHWTRNGRTPILLTTERGNV